MAQEGLNTNVGRRGISQLRPITIVIIVRNLTISDDGHNGERLTIIRLNSAIRFNRGLMFMRTQAGRLRYNSIRIDDRITYLFCFHCFFYQLMITLYRRHASGQREPFLAYQEGARPIRRFRLVLNAVEKRVVSNLSLLCDLIRVASSINGEANFKGSRDEDLFIGNKLNARPSGVISNRLVTGGSFFVFVCISRD